VRIALCNEVIAPMPFPKQCEYAAKLGYDGLEVAPYTLSDELIASVPRSSPPRAAPPKTPA
jgi:sugar phosphate isomerase/epimerase